MARCGVDVELSVTDFVELDAPVGGQRGGGCSRLRWGMGDDGRRRIGRRFNGTIPRGVMGFGVDVVGAATLRVLLLNPSGREAACRLLGSFGYVPLG